MEQKRSHIIILPEEPECDIEEYQKLWDNVAVTLLGIGSKPQLTFVGQKSFEIEILSSDGSVSYKLGYTGPATAEAMKAAGITDDEADGWVFILDVDNFAVQYCGLSDRSELYTCDVKFLSQSTSNEPANGITAPYRAVNQLMAN